MGWYKDKIFFIKNIGSRDAKLYLLIFTILFLSPNLAFIFPGLYGTYIAYLALALVSIASIPLLSHRGEGLLDIRGSLFISLVMAIAFTSTGFILGFLSRRTSIYTLPLDALILAVGLAAAEVARASLMALVKGRILKLLIGTIAGLVFGITILSFSYRLAYSAPQAEGVLRNLSYYMPQIIYSALVSEIHILGGLFPAIVFRLVVDGYWRLSPYIPNMPSTGVLAPIILSSAYLLTMALLPSYEKLRGYSSMFFRKGSMRRLASSLLDISMILIALLLLYSIYTNTVPLVVISGSMEPTFSVGDVVLVTRSRGSLEVGVGDVIAFWSEGQVVVHRVVSIAGDGFITKGDAMASPDPFIVKRDLVIGKVVGSIPKIGWVTIIMRSTPEGLRNIFLQGVSSYLWIPMVSIPILIITIIYKYLKRRI
ncbi:MAG: signal peptidase I [Sulfolobales archaeon]